MFGCWGEERKPRARQGASVPYRTKAQSKAVAFPPVSSEEIGQPDLDDISAAEFGGVRGHGCDGDAQTWWQQQVAHDKSQGNMEMRDRELRKRFAIRVMISEQERRLAEEQRLEKQLQDEIKSNRTQALKGMEAEKARRIAEDRLAREEEEKERLRRSKWAKEAVRKELVRQTEQRLAHSAQSPAYDDGRLVKSSEAKEAEELAYWRGHQSALLLKGLRLRFMQLKLTTTQQPSARGKVDPRVSLVDMIYKCDSIEHLPHFKKGQRTVDYSTDHSDVSSQHDVHTTFSDALPMEKSAPRGYSRRDHTRGLETSKTINAFPNSAAVPPRRHEAAVY